MRINEFRSVELYIVRCASFCSLFFFLHSLFKSSSDQSISFVLLLENDLNRKLNYMNLVFRCWLSIKLLCNLTIQLHNFKIPLNINWNMFCCNWIYNKKLWFGFHLDFFPSKFKWFVFDKHFTWKWLNCEHEPCSK